MAYRDICGSSLNETGGRELLTSLLVPRPIAWVSTLSLEAVPRPNVAPFSSVSPMCNRPILLTLACGRRPDGSRKCTAESILHHQEFVVNLVGVESLTKIPLSAGQFAGTDDKFSRLGITPETSSVVKAPGVMESLVSFECKLHHHQEFGDAGAEVDFFIGNVVFVRVRREPCPVTGEVATPFRPLGALAIDWYLAGGNAVYQPEHVSS